MSTIENGATAEERAAAMLVARGYTIVERNVECAIGELDIVARDARGVLVFVEVRSRRDGRHGDAAEMIGPGKRRRVARMARWYLHTMNPAFEEARFDVVAITGEAIELIEDAWRL